MSIADVAPIAAAQAPLNGPVDQRFIELIAHATARKHLLLAVRPSQDRLTMLSAHPLPAWLRINLSRLVGSFQESLIPADILAKQIDEAFAAIDSAADDQQPATVVSAVNGPADVPDDHDLLSTHSKALAVRLLDSIIFHAISQHASDIHLQPLAGQLLVRYRVDGVLITVRTLARALSEPLISRLKVMARMDVAEKRLPQDGRCSVVLSSVTQGLGRKIDLRIGTLPTAFGERVVVRILSTHAKAWDASIEHLRMPPHIQTPWLDRLSRASGIVLTTGPTGSGKTTTLYASLRWIVQATRSELNILTIEDPIEYDLSAMVSASANPPPISQTQVDQKKGMTFAAGLRHILRQDPDVIMVGEIRDSDTARTAIQASLTGHLVLSSLHTSDAPSGVARLMDLGVEPYLLSSTISAVLAQRLVRLIHPACQGEGCGACLQTGFQGRQGIYQLLVPDETLRRLIHERASIETLTAAASSPTAGGLRSLREAGQELIDQGLTRLDEVLRVTAGASS